MIGALGKWLGLTVVLAALILISFAFFETDINNWLDVRRQGPSVTQGAAGAIVVVSLASDVLLPIPSTLVMTAAGSWLGTFWGTVASWTGLTLGCGVGYFLGVKGGRGLRGRYFSDGQLQTARRWADRYGIWVLVLMRPLPILAELSIVYAGMAGFRFGPFMWIVGCCNVVVATFYCGLGEMALGAVHETQNGSAANTDSWALVISMGVPVLILLVVRVLGRKHLSPGSE